MPSVVTDWIADLPMQQQTVLLLAGRGPDGVAKAHPCKRVVVALRAFVYKSARLGRLMNYKDPASEFMSLEVFPTAGWENIERDYFEHVDSLPHHYHMHLVHAAEILGYKHPDNLVQGRWRAFYRRACHDLHMTPENVEQLDKRLDDWRELYWDVDDQG